MRVIFKEETNYYNMCDVCRLPTDIKLKNILNVSTTEESVRHAIRGIKRLFFGSDEPNQKGIVIDFGIKSVRIYSAEFTPNQIDYIFDMAKTGTNGDMNRIIGELKNDIDRVDGLRIGA